jgi:PAS domain S-box-containing protein
MQPLLRPLWQWLAMRSLRTQLQLTAAGLCVLGMLIVLPLSLYRLQRQIVAESTEWATALAAMAAHASNALLAPDDHAALEASLQEFVALPGVVQIEVMRPGGQPVMSVQRQPNGHTVTIRPHQEAALPVPQAWLQLDPQHHRVTAEASLQDTHRGTHPHGFDHTAFLNEGWVSVDVSYDERLAIAQKHWLEAAAGALALLLLGLGLFTLFLRRTVQPIRALAQFASTLVQQPGAQLMLRWGSREVRELGRTLNWSSQELARHISETQQRLSRLHAILDTAADAIIGVDAQGRIASANPAAERMFGHELQALLLRPLADILPGVDADRLHRTMAEGMLIHSTQSRIGRIETDALRHGGTGFPVEVLLGEIQGDQDIRYTCIVRDLTDLKLAEEYLTLYGRVLDCSPSGVSVSDARRYPQPIVHVNPAFTRITGYTPREILGRDASLLEGPQTDRDDLELLARTVQRGGELKITLHNYRKDGSLFHNKLSVSPVRDAQGEITHYINVIEDVSGQVEVKQRLIERTARLNATFDLSPDGFAVFDARGELITSNPALRHMLGNIPAWTPLDRFDEWVRNLCEDPASYHPVAQAPNDGIKHTLVLARPSHMVLERDIRRHLGGSGETFVYFRDVTHQFEVDRMKSEFLATAAHELRTPLASILGFTELMIHRQYSEEKRKDLLQTVHRQGTLLNNLIQELLDLSRIEARQGKDFHIVPTPLATIIDAAVRGTTHQELGRQVCMEPLPDWHVMADASKIEQALTNLLSNAFKYSPGGGDVRLTVREAERDGQAFAVVSVQDQGIGMTPAQLARAFERFYRADSSGNIPGTGLGLNLVKEIAEIHGGTVELESVPGEGTTASLWLRQATTAVDSDATVSA